MNSQGNVKFNINPILNFKTDSEAIGEQMLEQFNWVNMTMNEVNTIPQLASNSVGSQEDAFSYIDSFDKLEQLIERVKKSRSTIHSRLFQNTDMGDFDLMLNICNTCSGKIQHV